MKSISYFLPQSTVSCRSDSGSEANSSCCHTSDAWLMTEGSIISIDCNMTDNIIRKVTSVLWEKCRTKNGALKNSSINWRFLWGLPIHDHLKLSITEKSQNKAKYLTWNSMWLKFVKMTNMPNPVKSLEYIKCYSSSSSRPVKSPRNFIRYNCQKICSWLRRPKTILEIRKKATFF